MKTIIYLRTSTKEQNPELQKKNVVEFANSLNLDIIEIVSEQGSAYKLEKKRPKWEYVINRAKSERMNIIVWRYDRAFRNREEFYKFMKVMFEVYNVKVYSATEPSILSFWEMMDKSHSDNPIFNELITGIFKAMWDFMIRQAGEEAEEESKKKSQRVKLAVRKHNGVTKSYTGKKWGRKALHTNKIKIIMELKKQGTSYRDIAKKTNVSIGTISNLCSKIPIENIIHKKSKKPLK